MTCSHTSSSQPSMRTSEHCNYIYLDLSLHLPLQHPSLPCAPVSPVSSSTVNRHSSGGSLALGGRSSSASAQATPMPTAHRGQPAAGAKVCSHPWEHSATAAHHLYGLQHTTHVSASTLPPQSLCPRHPPLSEPRVVPSAQSLHRCSSGRGELTRSALPSGDQCRSGQLQHPQMKGACRRPAPVPAAHEADGVRHEVVHRARILFAHHVHVACNQAKSSSDRSEGAFSMPEAG